ncbi:hypothetical protein BH10PSE7_BH10PSE7_41550 [soil metagenome]
MALFDEWFEYEYEEALLGVTKSDSHHRRLKRDAERRWRARSPGPKR